jgi:hypothetical protein
MLKNL